MKIGILASAVGLAVSAIAVAEVAQTSQLVPINKASLVAPQIQIYQQTGFPRLDNGIVGDTRLSPVNGGREGRLPDGSKGSNTFDVRGTPNVIVARTDFQVVPADTSLGGAGQSFAPSFSSGMLPPNFGFNLTGQSSVNFVRVIDPVAHPTTPAPPTGPNGVANNTKMIRHRVAAAQAPNQFFTGHDLYMVQDYTVPAANQTLFPIAPTASNNAQASIEVYNTSSAELESFESVAAFTGFITGRILWGGTCTEDTPGDCTDVGLPIGPVTTYFSLGPDPTSFTTGIFVPATICQDAGGMAIPGCVPPLGSSIGDPASIILGQWHRMIGTTTSDGRFMSSLDRLDGNPAYAIYSNVILTSAFMDNLSSNASFEAVNVDTFFDNAEFMGEPFALPTPPPLDCPYLDDVEWLNTGPVLGQSQQVIAALSSAATVINDGARGKVYSQVNNVSSDNFYREELRRTLPDSFATAGDPWTLCIQTRTTGATVRGFAIDSELTNFVPGGVTTRVYLGREDPADTMNPFYENSIYVQIRADYDPIDLIDAVNPQDNPPIIDLDVADTGANWANDGVYRNLCMTIDVNNTVTVSVAGTNIYTGPAFANAATLVRFESENQAFAAGSQLRMNNIDLDCSALPIVSLPALTVPYLDSISWGVVGLPPSRHIDDPMTSPTTSTRFTNANGVVVDSQNIGSGASTLVAMQNVFRDTPQIAPPDINGTDAFVFTQFTTDTPSVPVTAGGSAKWVVEMDWALSDFLTSRGFAPAQLADVGGAFEFVGYMWYSAPDDTFYLFASPAGAAPGDDLVNINTGVTRSSLGITPGQKFTVKAEYVPASDMVKWSINSTVLGMTNPIVGMDDNGNTRIHRNLDEIFVFGGDNDTAPAAAPLSTLFLDNIKVTTGVTPCNGDTNGDRVINFADLNAVLATFGQSGAGLPGDVNGDNTVNFADLNVVLSNFGVTCP